MPFHNKHGANRAHRTTERPGKTNSMFGTKEAIANVKKAEISTHPS